jgi:hypothetical protein
MKKREEVLKVLNDYYNENGIIPDKEQFNCPNKDKCNNKATISNISLAQGMQCHIGSKFLDESKIKVLVVSLDCGSGGINIIEERTTDVEKNDHNPHMKGTKLILSNLFNNTDEYELLKNFSMTNSCKCSRIGSSDQLPDFFYEQCAEFKVKEIELINPDVVYFQGQRALIGINFENINDQTTDIFEYLKHVKIGNRTIYAVQCIHPSARGRNYKRRKDFYDNLLPKINEFLRDSIKVN